MKTDFFATFSVLLSVLVIAIPLGVVVGVLTTGRTSDGTGKVCQESHKVFTSPDKACEEKCVLAATASGTYKTSFNRCMEALCPDLASRCP